MIYHCTKCDHEWMTVVDPPGTDLNRENPIKPKTKCDWCGAKGKPIGTDYTDRPTDCRMDVNKMVKAWKNFFENGKPLGKGV